MAACSVSDKDKSAMAYRFIAHMVNFTKLKTVNHCCKWQQLPFDVNENEQCAMNQQLFWYCDN